jgi:hypothetical protein
MYDPVNESNGLSWDIPAPVESYYSPIFGTNLAMPEWEAIITLVFLSAVILTTIIGNILVIKPCCQTISLNRVVTNFLCMFFLHCYAFCKNLHWSLKKCNTIQKTYFNDNYRKYSPTEIMLPITLR